MLPLTLSDLLPRWVGEDVLSKDSNGIPPIPLPGDIRITVRAAASVSNEIIYSAAKPAIGSSQYFSFCLPSGLDAIGFRAVNR